MRHGDEQAQVAEWAFGLLATDQGLADALGVPLEALPEHVWADVAPGGTDAPWVVYTVGEALDVGALSAQDPRIFSAATLNVRVIHRASAPDVGNAVARRLYALIQGNHNAAVSDGGTILTATRTTALNYPEDVGGIQYRHTGGLYRVEIN